MLSVSSSMALIEIESIGTLVSRAVLTPSLPQNVGIIPQPSSDRTSIRKTERGGGDGGGGVGGDPTRDIFEGWGEGRGRGDPPGARRRLGLRVRQRSTPISRTHCEVRPRAPGRRAPRRGVQSMMTQPRSIPPHTSLAMHNRSAEFAGCHPQSNRAETHEGRWGRGDCEAGKPLGEERDDGGQGCKVKEASGRPQSSLLDVAPHMSRAVLRTNCENKTHTRWTHTNCPDATSFPQRQPTVLPHRCIK